MGALLTIADSRPLLIKPEWNVNGDNRTERPERFPLLIKPEWNVNET